MLKEYLDLKDIRLRSADEIDWFPRAKEREKWENISEDIKNIYIREGEKYLDYEWPSLLASNYRKLHTHNSRDFYDKPYKERRYILSKLVIAECMEYKGRFLPDIINGIQLICEEMTWVSAAHNISDYSVNWKNKEVFPMINSQMLDIYSGFTAINLGWTYFLLKDEIDAVSPIICENLRVTMDRKVFNPYLERDDIWWFTWGNNWNTGINDEIARSASLIIEDKDRLRRIIEKTIWSIDRNFEIYPDDGGCGEGVTYWHANPAQSYFGWLEYISYGEIKPFGQQKLKNIIGYIVNMYVGNNMYVPVSDAYMDLSDLYMQDLYDIAMMSGDERLKIMTAHKNYVRERIFDDLPKILKSLFNPIRPEFMEEYRDKKLVFDKTFYYESTQTAIWREKDTTGGLYCYIKGGHNKELHNHNDVGHFTIFNDCKPVIIDPGKGLYTHAAYSDDRYTIWFFNSRYHNVPYIGGIEQKDDSFDFGAKIISRTDCSITMDIAPAYNDDSVRHWIRSMKYDRTVGEYVVEEHYELTEEKDIDLHFILPEEPVINDDRIILSGGMELHYSDMAASYEKIDMNDSVMEKVWGELYRLKLTFRGMCGDVKYKIKRV